MCSRTKNRPAGVHYEQFIPKHAARALCTLLCARPERAINRKRTFHSETKHSHGTASSITIKLAAAAAVQSLLYPRHRRQPVSSLVRAELQAYWWSAGLPFAVAEALRRSLGQPGGATRAPPGHSAEHFAMSGALRSLWDYDLQPLRNEEITTPKTKSCSVSRHRRHSPQKDAAHREVV